MGLDMFLIRKRNIGKAKVKINILENEYSWYNNVGKKLEIKNCTVIEEEVGYWRKANQIHKWFVDNVQNGVDDCGEYEVSTEKLQELLNICKELIDNIIFEEGEVRVCQTLVNGKWIDENRKGKVIVNKELCEKLLPTESGFFFGNTEYNEYYYDDILLTLDILNDIVNEEDYDNYSYYYTSSW